MKKNLLLSSFFVGIFASGFGQADYISIESQTALGSELIDNAAKTAIDSEGNHLVFGTFSEQVDFDPTETEFILDPLGAPDLFLASYSADGDLNWAFNLGRLSLSDGMTARGLAIDAENNVIISGGFSLNVDFDPSANSSSMTAVQGLDGFVAKYNATGQLVWLKQFGSAGFDSVSALKIDDQGNHILGIRFGDEIDLDPSDGSQDLIAPVGGIDAAVVKLDPNGDYIWSYSVAPDVNNEVVTALALNSNGDIALGATVNGISSGIPMQSMLAGVLDTEGTEIWTYDFQNQGQSNTISHITFSQDNQSIYLGGRIQADTDFDPSDNEEIISPLFADPFLSKHSAADGSLAWSQYVESNSTSDYCAGVLESNGAVFLAGSYDVLAFFIPGDFTSQVPSNGSSDLFVSIYDSESGDFIEAATFGGEGRERANDAYFDDGENLVIVGQFNSSLTLIEGESITAQGFEDAFIAHFTYDFDLSSGIELKEEDINLYPVPATDQIFVQLNDVNTNSVAVKLINIIGQTVLETNFDNSSNRLKIDISALKQGVYLMEVRVGNSSITKRLIKQ